MKAYIRMRNKVTEPDFGLHLCWLAMYNCLAENVRPLMLAINMSLRDSVHLIRQSNKFPFALVISVQTLYGQSGCDV